MIALDVKTVIESCHQSGKTQCCGCKMMTLVDDVITAKDLGKVIIVRSSKEIQRFIEDLAWQEKQRKVFRF